MKNKTTVLEKLERIARVYRLNIDKLIDYVKTESTKVTNSLNHFIIMLEEKICTNQNGIILQLK